MNIHPGILLISTRKYKQFVQPLVHQIDEYFLPDHEKTIFVFTDEYMPELESTSNVIQILIESEGFPEITLHRYKIFNDNKAELEVCSHLFFLDVDMAVLSVIGDEILCDGLTVVYHPGFYSKKGWGSSGVVRGSLAWVAPEKRYDYVAGGFNGGRASEFLLMARILSDNIANDEARGVMAEWHDESHLNAFIKGIYVGEILYLTPSYCMVEQQELRKAWGIDDLPVKIIALAKNHSEIRS